MHPKAAVKREANNGHARKILSAITHLSAHVTFTLPEFRIARAAKADMAAVPVEQGEQVLGIDVSVTWEIK